MTRHGDPMRCLLRCRCGLLTGEVDLAGAYARATCHCRDCRAFARFLGCEDVLDAQGGSDVVALAPDHVRFEGGRSHLACMSLGPRGLLRWYADCCRTPLANTGRDPAQFYLGLLTACLDAPHAVLDEALGPRGRIRLFPRQATAPVAATPLRMALGGAGIFGHLAWARLRGRRNLLVFDPDGTPVREPRTLTREERAAVTDAAT